MIDVATMATLLGFFVVIGLVRVGRSVSVKRPLGPHEVQVLEPIPGSVLAAMLAPMLVTGEATDLVALALTLYAATRFSLLPVVVFAVIVSAALRGLWPA